MLNTNTPDLIFEEFIRYLTAKYPPEFILSFKTSDALQARADELTERNKDGIITSEEREELEQMIKSNSMLSVLKARAMRILKERERDNINE